MMNDTCELGQLLGLSPEQINVGSQEYGFNLGGTPLTGSQAAAQFGVNENLYNENLYYAAAMTQTELAAVETNTQHMALNSLYGSDYPLYDIPSITNPAGLDYWQISPDNPGGMVNPIQPPPMIYDTSTNIITTRLSPPIEPVMTNPLQIWPVTGNSPVPSLPDPFSPVSGPSVPPSLPALDQGNPIDFNAVEFSIFGITGIAAVLLLIALMKRRN